MKTQMYMVMTMTLCLWVIEIDSDKIKAERVLVSTRTKLSTRERTFSIRVAMYKKKIRNLIIDSGSYANVANTNLVIKLNMCTIKHNIRCRLLLLNDCGEVKVTK